MLKRKSGNKGKILVVDDEEAVLELLKEWLEEADYTVLTALDGLTGLRQFFENRPDLVIIDIRMPKMDGFELCQRIREVSEVPIIVLSALGHELDKVRGLELGADDYLVKPVSEKEFLARVAAALRRAKMPPVEPLAIYSDGVITLDFKRHEALVRGKPVSLTPIEYRLLAYLVQSADQVLTREQLWDRVWGFEYGSPDSVKWYISSLRKKIEEDPENPSLIITVRGVGYRYKKPVQEDSPQRA